MIENLEGEIWKDIIGYEGLYKVSNLGRVKSLRPKKNNTEYLMTPSFNKKTGYVRVILTKNHQRKHPLIHRLVAQAFIPNPDNLPEVNHKDEDKLNHKVSNLEWCTSKYNANYGTRNERLSKANSGEHHHLYGCTGALNPSSIPVYCVELDKVFDNAVTAAKEVGLFNGTHINSCCKGIGHTAGGYHWKYASEVNNAD